MRKQTTIALLVILLCSLLLAGIVFTASASTTEYALTWWTVDNGGGLSTNGDYALVGDIGQPDTGAMSGGSYKLAGGFWGGGAAAELDRFIYLPLILRQSS